MRLLVYIIFFIVSCTISVAAQVDSPIVQLPIVEIIEQKLSPTQNQIFKTNSNSKELMFLELNTEDLIQLFSGGYLREYGNKTLGTLSIRGGSSQQSVVLWNGADIGNPMLGQSDISMLPFSFFNEISINSTNADNAYNPIGGALQLNSKLSDSTNYTLGFSAGQFDYYQGIFKGQHHLSPKFTIGMRAFSISDQQNFPYKEEHESVFLPEYQPHAQHVQNGFLGQAKYKVNDVHTIKVATWLQSLQRELPPKRTQRISEAIQADTVVRGQFEWSSSWQNYHQSLLFTIRNESNTYNDPREGISESNHFSASQLISKHRVLFSDRFYTNFGVNANWYQVSTPNYENEFINTSRFQAYLNPVYKPRYIPLQFDVAVRINHDRDELAPVTGHVKAHWIHKKHRITLGVLRAHRFPSLNDLYWVPGGNKELNSELSHQINLGYQFSFSDHKIKTSSKINLFYKNVDDWILWAPMDQSALWSPFNILEVTSKGLDVNQSFNYTLSKNHKFRLQLNLLIQSVRNTSDQSSPLAQKGAHLIYMPDYKAGGQFTWHFKNFTAMYLHHWRSKIYTNPNLNESLGALSLGQFRLSYSLNILEQKVQVFVRSFNLWNTTYYYQTDRPAPGTQWRVGFMIQNQ